MTHRDCKPVFGKSDRGKVKIADSDNSVFTACIFYSTAVNREIFYRTSLDEPANYHV